VIPLGTVVEVPPRAWGLFAGTRRTADWTLAHDVFVPADLRLHALHEEPRPVDEPMRYRAALEAAVRSIDHPEVTVARLGWRQVRREDSPATFPALHAIASWGLAPALTYGLRALEDWLRALERIRESPWGPGSAPRFLARYARAAREELAHGDVLGRVVGAGMAEDLEAALVARAGADLAALLARLDTDLERAAGPRGVARAEREARARLVGLREAWTSVPAWDERSAAQAATERVRRAAQR
jgi:hypothetical protein